jgi:hypothetical protein
MTTEIPGGVQIAEAARSIRPRQSTPHIPGDAGTVRAHEPQLVHCRPIAVLHCHKPQAARVIVIPVDATSFGIEDGKIVEGARVVCRNRLAILVDRLVDVLWHTDAVVIGVSDGTYRTGYPWSAARRNNRIAAAVSRTTPLPSR